MKKIAIITFFIGLIISVNAQDTIRKTMTWNHQTREYIVYKPATRSGNLPVMFCLHGMGSNATEFLEANIDEFADATGWIIVSPQALSDTILVGSFISLPFQNVWGAGVGLNLMGSDYILNEDRNDVGFLTSLLDSVKKDYTIDEDSVFFFGFSLGGFMAQRMAIEKGNLITAVASVSGTIGNYCPKTPVANVNMIHIHGTNDQTISYENASLKVKNLGSFSVGLGAEATVRLWNRYNNCDTVNPIITHYPNTSATDSATYTRYIYPNGNNQSYNAFIKVENGKHEWHSITDSDIDYVTEVYEFFTHRMPLSVQNNTPKTNTVRLYPNPAYNTVTISTEQPQNGTLTIYNMLGKKIMSQKLSNTKTTLDISSLVNGIYMAQITTAQSSKTLKLIVEK